jgi:hypothetical protein
MIKNFTVFIEELFYFITRDKGIEAEIDVEQKTAFSVFTSEL